VLLLLADAVLAVHLALVVFVVGGLILIVAGNLAGWDWVNRPALRLLHAAAIATVVAEAWFGVACPLTTPIWAFVTLYTVFGLLVGAAWWYFPPRWHSKTTRTRKAPTSSPPKR
jgi:hypothetical protein